MINLLKSKAKKEYENYTERENLLKKISTFEELYSEFLSIEPHCFLHAGAMSNTISKMKLNGTSAISIGMDILKEFTLAKKNNLKIDVFDIDEKSVSLANKFSNDLKIFDSLKYFNQNILSSNFTFKNNYELAILSQMDYILSDKEIEIFLKKIATAGIKYVLILTPSVFSFSPSPYKIIDLIFNLLRTIKSNLNFKSKDYFITFSRRKSYLLNLFRKNYYCIYNFDYAYPSGREYLFLLKSKNFS